MKLNTAHHAPTTTPMTTNTIETSKKMAALAVAIRTESDAKKREELILDFEQLEDAEHFDCIQLRVDGTPLHEVPAPHG